MDRVRANVFPVEEYSYKEIWQAEGMVYDERIIQLVGDDPRHLFKLNRAPSYTVISGTLLQIRNTHIQLVYTSETLERPHCSLTRGASSQAVQDF